MTFSKHFDVSLLGHILLFFSLYVMKTIVKFNHAQSLPRGHRVISQRCPLPQPRVWQRNCSARFPVGPAAAFITHIPKDVTCPLHVSLAINKAVTLLPHPSFFSLPAKGVCSPVLAARGSGPPNSREPQDQCHWRLPEICIKIKEKRCFWGFSAVCCIWGFGVFFSFRTWRSLKPTMTFIYPCLCDVKVSKDLVFILWEKREKGNSFALRWFLVFQLLTLRTTSRPNWDT